MNKTFGATENQDNKYGFKEIDNVNFSRETQSDIFQIRNLTKRAVGGEDLYKNHRLKNNGLVPVLYVL